MIVAFTGTQADMTGKQFDAVLELLTELKPREIHHGDCIGADARFHAIAVWLNHENLNCQIKIHVHPPTNNSKRAFCEDVDVMHEPKDYLDRNHDIVDACDVLIACPKEKEEKRRSGTWATYRYAKKQGLEIHLILP